MKHSKETMLKIQVLNILDVASKLNISVINATGKFRRCQCFMHPDKHPSMWFKLSNNTWSCPVCDKGGGIVSLVMEHESLSLVDAVDWLIKEFHIEVSQTPAPYQPLKSSRRSSASCWEKKATSVDSSSPGASIGATATLGPEWVTGSRSDQTIEF